MIPGKQYSPELLVQIARRYKWRILLPFVLLATAGSAVVRSLPNLYQSEALILVVPQRVPENYVRSAVTTRLDERLQAIRQQILSRTRLERIIQDFNLYADRRKTDIMEDIVERMRKDIELEVVKGDSFRISFRVGDPRTSMRVTERLASFFIDENLRDREALAEGTNQFLDSQLAEARARLIGNEKQLEEYRRQHDGELPTQTDANIQGQHNTEMQLQALIDSLNRDRDRRLELQRVIAANSAPDTTEVPGIRPAAPDDSAAVSAVEQLRVAQLNLQALLRTLKPKHPDVLQLQSTIAELQRRVDTASAERSVSEAPPVSPTERSRHARLQDAQAESANLDREIAAKSGEEKRLRAVLGRYQQRLETTPTRDAELSELTRDYSTNQKAYETLLAKKQDSQIVANLERRQIGEQFTILDPARLPEKPTSPDRPKLYLLAAVVGLAFGFAMAGISEYLDRTLRSEEDVRLVLNFRVLATIPDIRPSHRAMAFVAVSAAAVLLVAVAAVAWELLR